MQGDSTKPRETKGPPGLREIGMRLWLGLVFTLAASIILGLVWDFAGLPDRPGAGAMAEAARPWGLRLFVAWVCPGALFISSLFLAAIIRLAPRREHEQAGILLRRSLRIDAFTYLFLPALILLCLAWPYLERPYSCLGLLFLALILAKAFVFLSLAWQGFLSPLVRPGSGLGLRSQTAVLLAVWAVLGLGSVWVNQAVSTASDEVGYLLMTHSLANQGTQNPAQAVKEGAYKEFYWGRWSPALVQTQRIARSWLFPPLLTPAYALGGRLGILLMFCGLMALLAVQLLVWLEANHVRAGPAAAAVGLVLGSAPVFFLSQQAYPDVPVMLLFVVGLRLLGALDRRPWAAGAGLMAIALAIAGLKVRLALLSLGLLAMAMIQLAARRWGWRRTLSAAVGLFLCLALALWLVPIEWLPVPLYKPLELALHQLGRADHFWQPALIFFRGLAVDQNYGVLFVAPIFLLALAGIPAAMRRNPVVCGQVLLPMALYLAAMCLTRWFQWYAGFSVPGRFAAVFLPATALFLGLSLQALSRPWLRLLAWLPAVWGLAYTLLGLLHAQQRFSRAGLNPLVAKAQDYLGLELHHLFPSTFIKSPALAPTLVAGFLALAGLAVLVWRLVDKKPSGAGEFGRRDLWAFPLAVLILGGGLLAAAKIFPPTFIEAEHMRPLGATLWTEYAFPGFKRGMVMLNGKAVQGRLHFPGGPVRLRLLGMAYKEGSLQIKVDDRVWHQAMSEGQMEADLDLGPISRGYHRIEVSWSSCPTRACPFLLDRLEVVQEPDPKASS
ncbi:MAG: hypothetical protein PVG03_07280 [Desulfarculaceae bacterium]|jgi:hypothetical protein